MQRRRRRGGGFDDVDADWPTDVSSSSSSSPFALAQRRHTFAADGFAALDPSLLDASDERKGGGGGGGVCCYVVPLHNGQCKDADIIHDFDLRAALAIARSGDALAEEVVEAQKGEGPHPSVVSTTTVSLLPREADGDGDGGGDGGGGGVGDVGGKAAGKTNMHSLLARLSAAEVDAADVVYLDVGGGRRAGPFNSPHHSYASTRL